MAEKGWGAKDVGKAYTEARNVEEKLVIEDEAAIDLLRFEVGIGLWSHKLVRGDLQGAGAEAARLTDLATRASDPSMRIVALRAAGTTAFWLGRFVDAELHLRACLDELADGTGYRPFATDLGTAPLSLISSDLADTLWALGRYNEAVEMMTSARAQALVAGHPFHDCYSLAFSCWLRLKLGNLASAAEDGSRLHERASNYGLDALRTG